MADGDYGLSAGRSIDASSPIVTLNVGEPPVQFFVHEKTLCSSSKYFQSMFKPEWSQPKAQNLNLKDHEVGGVTVYINWLYTRDIPLAFRKADSQESHANDWINLARAYVTGEFSMDSEFQTSVINALRYKFTGPYGLSFGNGRVIVNMSQIIYAGTSARSPARLFVLMVFKRLATKVMLSVWNDSLPKDLFIDLVTEALPLYPEHVQPNETERREMFSQFSSLALCWAKKDI